MTRVLDKAVLRLRKQALIDIVNDWVKRNFVAGSSAVNIEPSVNGDEFQITVETLIDDRDPSKLETT